MTQHHIVGAFVLVGKRPIPWQSAPRPSEVYDPELQVWIHSDTGKPIVLMEPEDFKNRTCTPFGETEITETREGIDQPESTLARTFSASPFGETLITRTREGVDQPEAMQFSPFGETIYTATREGIDQSETSNRYVLEEETE